MSPRTMRRSRNACCRFSNAKQAACLRTVGRPVSKSRTRWFTADRSRLRPMDAAPPSARSRSIASCDPCATRIYRRNCCPMNCVATARAVHIATTASTRLESGSFIETAMTLRLVQLTNTDGTRCVASVDDNGRALRIEGAMSTYGLAQLAIEKGTTLEAAVAPRITKDEIDLDRALDDNRVLAPIDHLDPAHVYLTGTGLTHLGSAEGRDKMHKAAAAGAVTDSMRMFMMGVEGGK